MRLLPALLLLALTGSAGAAPVPWAAPHLPTRHDSRLEAQLARIGEAFDGEAGIFVEDLRSGRFAGWNEEAQLPAASTVKLAVIAEGIRRFGFGPSSPVDRDLRAIGRWSSNAAANRVFALVGGRVPTEAALRRLGMFSSTYPAPYALSPAEKPKKKRTTSASHVRVTTARDLARALFRLDAAAAGQRWAIRGVGLSRAQARAALGYLALAEPSTSVFSFPAGTARMEKDGWLADVRASAALAVRGGRARIVVVIAARDGVTLAEARRLGAQVLAAAR